MISAVIIIGLLSLLVATEPESVQHTVPPSPEPPLHVPHRHVDVSFELQLDGDVGLALARG